MSDIHPAPLSGSLRVVDQSGAVVHLVVEVVRRGDVLDLVVDYTDPLPDVVRAILPLLVEPEAQTPGRCEQVAGLLSALANGTALGLVCAKAAKDLSVEGRTAYRLLFEAYQNLLGAL